jgi:hypothetical protein
VAAVAADGLSIPDTARLGQGGLPFLKKMLKWHRAGEPLEPRQGGGPLPVRQEQETTRRRQDLSARPDAPLEAFPQVLTDNGQATVRLSTRSRS